MRAPTRDAAPAGDVRRPRANGQRDLARGTPKTRICDQGTASRQAWLYASSSPSSLAHPCVTAFDKPLHSGCQPLGIPLLTRGTVLSAIVGTDLSAMFFLNSCRQSCANNDGGSGPLGQGARDTSPVTMLTPVPSPATNPFIFPRRVPRNRSRMRFHSKSSSLAFFALSILKLADLLAAFLVDIAAADGFDAQTPPYFIGEAKKPSQIIGR